jgi:uncharacterized protein YbaR (Trm112 family)
MISEQLLELLACPVCHDRLLAAPERSGLLCEQCRLVFPVREGIPVMLKDEAQRISGKNPGAQGK